MRASRFTTRATLSAWLVLLALVSYGYFVYSLALDYWAGGHSWKQGDWLINSGNGSVRRSITGDLAIGIADALRADLLLVVIVAQALIVGLLYWLTLRLAFLTPGIAFFLLAFSPAFFMIFWIADPLGSARKEMLTFTALLAFTLGTCRDSRGLAVFGSLTFLVSVAAHEAMILFTPVFWGVLLMHRKQSEKARFHLVLLLLTTAAAITVCYALMMNGQTDSFMRVCQPLLDRGVQEHMCNGAIRWLEYDLAYGIEFVSSRTSPTGMLLLLMTYAVCLAPFLYVTSLSGAPRLFTFLSFAPFFLVLPLYITAADHGRWISFHVFMSLVLFAVAEQSGRLRLIRAPNRLVLAGMFVVSLVFAPTHVRGVSWGGAARRILADVFHWSPFA